MKIRDVLNEAGMLKSIGKGIARAIAPDAVRDWELRKRLQLMPTAQQPNTAQPPQPTASTQTAQQPTTAQTQQPKAGAQTAQPDQPSWNPKKKILTVNGQQYRKTSRGWQDIATDELIEPKYAAELNTAFDQATGRRPVPGQPAAAPQAAPAQPAQPKQPTQPAAAAQSTQAQTQPAAPAADIPDVSQLTPEERAELIRQIKQKLGQAQ